MGLYDGRIGAQGFASTAHVATLTKSPVVLVVDISRASRSVGAVVHGMATFDAVGRDRRRDPEQGRLAPARGRGRRLHRPADPRHPRPRRRPSALPRATSGWSRPPSADEAAHALDALADRIADAIDLEAVLKLAVDRARPGRRAVGPGPRSRGFELARPSEPPVPTGPSSRWPAGARSPSATPRPRSCSARPAAGSRRSTRWSTRRCPEGTSGIYLGGGFPEVHATGLSDNAPLRADLHAAIEAGVPTVAECAGLLYLCRSVDDAEMVGALPATARDDAAADAVAIPSVPATADSLLTRAGEMVTGHEFHRTHVDPAPGRRPGLEHRRRPVGFAGPTLHASYLHVHWAGHPQLAQRFADAVHMFGGQEGRRHSTTRSVVSRRSFPAPQPPRHHGPPAPPRRRRGPRRRPARLRGQRLPRPAAALARPGAARQPRRGRRATRRPTAAEAAVAQRHGSTPTRCSPPPAPRRRSPCSPGHGRGAARWSCTLSSPSRTPRSSRPATPSPRSCSRTPFALDPALVPDDADLVMVGNPTNPTGVLHPAETLRALTRPGRLVVVDEAFIDTVPGEAETVAGEPGFLVIRSLTKHWSIPGVRAGYAHRARRRDRRPAPGAVALVGVDDGRRRDPGLLDRGRPGRVGAPRGGDRRAGVAS